MGLQMPHNGSKARIFYELNAFCCKKFLMKRFGGYGKLFAGCRMPRKSVKNYTQKIRFYWGKKYIFQFGV